MNQKPTRTLAYLILQLLRGAATGPEEAMDIIVQVIGTLAIQDGGPVFPKESSAIFRVDGQQYRVSTTVDKVQ